MLGLSACQGRVCRSPLKAAGSPQLRKALSRGFVLETKSELMLPSEVLRLSGRFTLFWMTARRSSAQSSPM